ncbi:MAG: cysteine--tRNA ligase [Patescibacteria group bacterium]
MREDFLWTSFSFSDKIMTLKMIKLFNTITAKKEIFKSLKRNRVSIYTCGPTVYWYAHLGNFKTYIFEDILRRTLKYNRYKIKQVMNITDVEDKIIKKSQSERKSISRITEPYTKIFFHDLKKINIEKAEFFPKATDHIKEMINIIKTLLKKGVAYKGLDGSIYFNVSKFKNYGKLSKLNKREIILGARVSSDEYKKEEAQDFVLWKSKKPNEPYWPSPFGEGRPGWHIECSAMAIKYLGASFDIHAGAVDLIFPHHENEIAQSEAATGKKFANYWIHGEHILVDGQKMSKSLGNFYTLRDIENKKINPLAFRYFVLNSHYRSKLNFTWPALESAQSALDNLYEIISQLKNTGKNNKKMVNFFKENFLKSINDDLNTPKALSVLWQIIKEPRFSDKDKKQLITEFDKVLSLGLSSIKPFKIPLKIKELAGQREILRNNKQFIPADTLRKKIERLGYIVEDTEKGPKVRKIINH